MKARCAFSILGLSILTGLLAGGCHGGGGMGGSHAALDLGGSWQGDWTSATSVPGSTISLSLSQESTTVVGSVEVTGWGCFDMGTVECEIMGRMIHGWFSNGGTRIEFEASCSGPNDGMMDGSYEVMSGGSCTGERGSFHLTRASGAAAPPPPDDPQWVLTVQPLGGEDTGDGEAAPGYEAHLRRSGANGSPSLEIIEVGLPVD